MGKDWEGETDESSPPPTGHGQFSTCQWRENLQKQWEGHVSKTEEQLSATNRRKVEVGTEGVLVRSCL